METKLEKQLIEIEPAIQRVLHTLGESGYKSLIVGGAVRDAILGFTPKDIDIEVYKISYDQLVDVLSRFGHTNLVGKNFGVIKFKPYLSPSELIGGAKMDYDFSVPRKENKIGVGHKDFSVTFDIDMTIEEAAMRRDFTFNALAYDPIANVLYDFFGGVDDLNNKVIRHTSDKFSEDSLRILRAMQFQARFDFTIHPDTIQVMRSMLINTTEFSELPKERIFEEWKKWAEKGINHSLIFQFMRDTSLINYYPELKRLKETPQDAIYHPEGDVEKHTVLCLTHMDDVLRIAQIEGDDAIILVMSILLHDIAKPATTEEKMKRGRMTITSEGHEEMGGKMCVDILSRLGFHSELITPISNLVANHLAGVNISTIPSQSGKVKSVKKLSRRLFPATINQLLYVMEADSNGRGYEEYRQPTGWQDIQEIAETLDLNESQYEYILKGRHLIEAGLKPSNMFGEVLAKANLAQEDGAFSDIDGAKKWLAEHLTVTHNG
jgi:tRNA nucleotidyltransferase (CCA-adding enzyme)